MNKSAKTEWTVTPNTDNAKYLGPIEFQDNKGEFHDFEVLHSKESNRLVFGGACNVGFIESGYLPIGEDESLDEALQEMLDDLETYYSHGEFYVSRIICNKRM